MKNFLIAGLLAALALNFSLPVLADTNDVKKVSPAKSSAQLVDAAKAAELIAAKKVIVLDVRTPSEFAAGHIAGATNLNIASKDFEANLAKLPKDKSYLVNCAAGVRSARACDVMTKLEFKSLYDLKGGMKAWEAAGKPVEK